MTTMAVENEVILNTGAPVSLARVDALELPEVVYKFVDYYDVEEYEAEALFFETRRWLWLCATSLHERESGLKPPDLQITGSLFWLDEMWHTFLLFTEPYHDFCRDYLGRYIHHRPSTRAEKTRRRQATEQSAAFVDARAGELRRQCRYICEKLDDETAVRWYREYAQRYSATELFARAKMRQPAF